MNDSEQTRLRFGESGEEELREYQPLNRWAVTALVIALASPLALVHWLLCLIPLCAITFAVVALRVRKDQPAVGGRRLALIALVIGVFCLSYVAARNITFRRGLEAQAKQHADHWLSLVRGGSDEQLYEAYELHLPYTQRQAKDIDLAARYGDPASEPVSEEGGLDDPPPHYRFAVFFHAEPMTSIRTAGQRAQFEFIGADGVTTVNNVDVVYLSYEAIVDDRNATKVIPFVVEMRRSVTGHKSRSHWRVKAIHEGDTIDVPISSSS